MHAGKLVIVGFLLCGIVWLPGYGQHTDESFITTSKSCSGVKWSGEMLKRYPNIAAWCQSIEFHDGVTYVKFSGTVRRTENQGAHLTLSMKGGGEVTVKMPAAVELSIDGRVVPLAHLERGDKLNFYVPQSRVVAQFYAANEPADAMPAIVAPFENASVRIKEPQR